MKTAIILLAVGLALSGCATTGAVTAGAQTTISKAQQDVQTALDVYGVAKGIAQVATIADPSLVWVLSAATASLDPLAAQAQTALNDATTDANALEALATAINAQTAALTAAAAPKITVVPTPAPTAG